MNVRIFFSVILGTIILLGWNIASWLYLPFHKMGIQNLPPAVIDTANIQEMMPYDGVFQYPDLVKKNQALGTQMFTLFSKPGPRITLMVYQANPTTPFSVNTLIIDGILDLLTVILLIIILVKIQDKSMMSIWSTCVISGAIIGLVSDFAEMNWRSMPLDFTIANVFDHLIAFTLLGLFLGIFISDNKNA